MSLKNNEHGNPATPANPNGPGNPATPVIPSENPGNRSPNRTNPDLNRYGSVIKS